ncbi:MAG: glycerol-3-phosphate dehydrogenase [Myxococcota bacterium]|nr:glycerol-3-phosphate dehydrogenase [Myxococcota bacterium]
MRSELFSELESQAFDIVVVGGGITGCGAARDAARRGLKVAMIEADDIASGTSSRSSKLVHGGLRYLEQYEFSLVFEAVSERKTLQDIAPHLVNPMGFMFPIYDHSRVGVNTLRAGLWLYDGLSMFRSPKLHEAFSPKKALEVEPLLEGKGLKGVPLYWDCATDDARLTLETALDALEAGATIATHTRVTGLVHNESGRVCGVRVRDQLPGGGREYTVQTKAVINATGPWTDGLRAMADEHSKLLAPTKGVHIVVPASRLPIKYAVVLNHPVDKRVLFAIPWGTETYIGTTDTYFEGDPAEVCADLADIDYLLDASNSYFPTAALVRDDVIATWAGLRPLISQEGASESSVSREHEIHVSKDGLITIAGGKLTTYRRMGGEVVSKAMDLIKMTGGFDQAIEDPRTGREPLPGAVGWPEDDDANTVAERIADKAQGKLSPETATFLAHRYGTRGVDIAALAVSHQALLEPMTDGRPEIMALVDWAVTQELALTVTDVLERRTQLFFRDVDQGLGAVDKVSKRMAELLGWDEQRRIQEVVDYQEEVARSRRWRSEI